jgi:DNA-directed RNA polymerase specialized sigma24 family protein
MSTLPVDILERDWQRELAGGALAERLQRWREVEPALWPFTRPASLIRYLGPATPAASKDVVLCALLRRAREDPVAARLVLQALLPALKRRVGRVLIDVDEREELWSGVLYRLWRRIRSYPVGRLPHHVAANLALSAVRDELRARERERKQARGRVGEPSPELPDHCADDGDIDMRLAEAVDGGAITAWEAELIARTRVDGELLGPIAAARGVRLNTLVQARVRAERRLLMYLGARVSPKGGRFGLSVVLGSPGEGPADPSGEKTNRHP